MYNLKVGDLITVESDNWDDLCKHYYVMGFQYRLDYDKYSTAVELVLSEDLRGSPENYLKTTVASHRIKHVNI